MRYIADSKSPCAVLDLDHVAKSGLDLSFGEAFAMVRKSKVYSDGEVVTWDPAGGFTDGSGPWRKTGEAKTTAEALSLVMNSPESVTFVIAVNLDDGTPHGDDLKVQIGAAMHSMDESLGKRLVLVAKNGGHVGRIDAFLPDGKYTKARVEHTKTAAARPSGASLNEFVEALRADAPATGEWPFADPKWVSFINDPQQLNTKQINELVEGQVHLKSVARVRQALTDVQELFIERDFELEMMVACALARVNMVFLGPPGTGKSLMVRSFADRLGVQAEKEPIERESELMMLARQRALKARDRRLNGGTGGISANGDGTEIDELPVAGRRMFEYLLTRYTTPEELFGAIDVDLLIDAGVHARRSVGMLPQAEVAFLDEIFKANSAILNTLLSITNEKIFYNMGQAFAVGLAFVVGASNETPDEEELGALYDRFPIRVPCASVDADLLGKVIRKAHAFDIRRWQGNSKTGSGTTPNRACLNDIRFLSRVVQEAAYGGADPFDSAGMEKEFTQMLLMLRDEYGVSDRTPIQILRVCRALALLEPDGPASQLRSDHLRAWGYVAPRISEARDLKRLVSAHIKKKDPQASRLFTDVF